jgi:hypothetical protein
VTDLPFVDRPCTRIDAEQVTVWAALVGHLGRLGAERALTSLFVRGIAVRDRRPSGGFPQPGSTIRGFRVAASEPPRRLLLEGRHRFSTYELEFHVRQDARGSELCAETRAAFPGLTGRLYRAAVIGSRGHRLAVGGMLRTVKQRAEATRGARA